MIFFLLLIIVIIFIMFCTVSERFKGTAATITQSNGNYVVQPITGFNGPLKINYELSDSKTSNLPSSLILKVDCLPGKSRSTSTGLCQ